jgi:hypothetical protein
MEMRRRDERNHREVRPSSRLLVSVTLALLLGAGAASAEAAVMKGTSKGDRLTGTSRADTIRGGAGADAIKGRGGADRLRGGRGADLIKADGLDHIKAGGGNDRVELTADRLGAKFRVHCGGGRDTLVVLRLGETTTAGAVLDEVAKCETLTLPPADPAPAPYLPPSQPPLTTPQPLVPVAQPTVEPTATPTVEPPPPGGGGEGGGGGGGEGGGGEGPPPPDTLYASPSGSGDCSAPAQPCTVGAAYQLAATRDTIVLEPGDYDDWETPVEDKEITITSSDGEMPAADPVPEFGVLKARFANVTFLGVRFARIDTRHLGAHHLVFENFDVDGSFMDREALIGGDGGQHQFLYGDIGNVADTSAVRYHGTGHVFDDVLFHDVQARTAGKDTSCMFSTVDDLTIANSIFHQCAKHDLLFHLGFDPPRAPYGGITLQNNVFEHSTESADDQDSWSSSCAVAVGSLTLMQDWDVRNNTFEGCVDLQRLTTVAGVNRWVSNVGIWDCLKDPAGLPLIQYGYNIGTYCGGATDDDWGHGADPLERGEVWGWANQAGFDFHLLETSALVGMGDPENSTEYDRDRQLRDDGSPDVGAYEYRPDPEP